MWLILQQDEPGDYVIATGKTHTVRDFCQAAFEVAGITLEWTGIGISEKGIDADTGHTMVEVDPGYFRPTEVQALVGDSTKARKILGWEPKTTFIELVKMMVESDLARCKRQASVEHDIEKI